MNASKGEQQEGHNFKSPRSLESRPHADQMSSKLMSSILPSSDSDSDSSFFLSCPIAGSACLPWSSPRLSLSLIPLGPGGGIGGIGGKGGMPGGAIPGGNIGGMPGLRTVQALLEDGAQDRSLESLPSLDHNKPTISA
eukprot:CAMPEP_0169065014 /NCGR_PEP_ID=MMETSP1015-20121227/2167_1 /TAXON_ID=342587 /ORGANISM="Karlodinium micrum, Strain CCMP2283" /LENGTH=137 /DNA_ID=CAMNT_0009123539 /DNA_START=38 /DNA_END=451 /DNA_ORIENTATION=-